MVGLIQLLLVISGFRRDVDEICALLGCYAAYSGNSLRTFRYNLAVPSSKVNNSNLCWISWLLKMGPIGCPETSVRNYHSTLRNIPEERRSLFLLVPYIRRIDKHWLSTPVGRQFCSQDLSVEDKACLPRRYSRLVSVCVPSHHVQDALSTVPYL